jgi:hypothetical protein
MLGIAIALLFGLAALVALAVIHASVAAGVLRAREIMVELAEIERRASVTRTSSPIPRSSRARLQALAAA